MQLRLRQLFWLALALVALTSAQPLAAQPAPAASEAPAQQLAPSDGSGDEATPEEPAPSQALPPDALRPPAVELASLDTRWRILRRAEAGSTAETAAMQALQRTAIELGLSELPAHSLVLLQEADAALRAGDVGRAETLKTWAHDLSPRSAQPAFFDARVAWEARPYDVARIAGHLTQAYRELSGSLSGAAALGILARLAFAEVLVGLSLLFVLLLLLRHSASIALDLRLLAGRTLTLPQGQALLVLCLLATWLFTSSLFALLAVGIALTAFHVGLKERVLLALAVGALVAVPLLAHDYARLVAANELSNSRIVSAIVAPCDARCDEQLRRLEAQGRGNASLALAWVSYRRGTRSGRAEALAHLDALNASPAAAVPAVRSSATSLRANVAFAQADWASADMLYRAAFDTAESPAQRAAALFGLYRAQLASGQRELAADTLNLAMRADDRVVARHLDPESTTQNAVLPTSPLPASAVMARGLGDSDTDLVDDASGELLEGWFGAVPASFTPPIAGALALCLLLGGLLKRRHRVAARCTRCGSPTHRAILADAYDRGVCALCYPLITGAGMLTFAQRRAREYRIDRWATRTQLGGWVADLLVPGAGHFCQGRTLLALPCLALAVAAVVLVTLDTTPLSVPYALGSDRLFTGQVPLAVGAAVLAYALALVGRIYSGESA